jgi:hypothetical protein
VPTVITDGMIPAALSSGLAELVLVAADRVTLDGHVVNKVGTLAAALAAQAFGIPFYALVEAPDPHAPRIEDVVIEHRDGAEVLRVLGKRSAADGAVGYYPAFDVTPPGLVTRIATANGVYAPSSVAGHFAAEGIARALVPAWAVGGSSSPAADIERSSATSPACRRDSRRSFASIAVTYRFTVRSLISSPRAIDRLS